MFLRNVAGCWWSSCRSSWCWTGQKVVWSWSWGVKLLMVCHSCRYRSSLLVAYLNIQVRLAGGSRAETDVYPSSEWARRRRTDHPHPYTEELAARQCFIYAVITGLGMNYHSRQWIFRKTPEFPHTSAKQWHLKQHIRLINWCMDLDACVIILCNIWSYCCPSWSGHSCKRLLISRVFPLEG